MPISERSDHRPPAWAQTWPFPVRKEIAKTGIAVIQYQQIDFLPGAERIRGRAARSLETQEAFDVPGPIGFTGLVLFGGTRADGVGMIVGGAAGPDSCGIRKGVLK